MAGLVGDAALWLQKLNILQQDGCISMDSYQAKAQHLQQHGRLPEAGVGMTIRDMHPFSIEDLRPDGPAAKAGVIKIGDEITKVDGCSLRESLTGEQVLMRQSLSALLGRSSVPRLCCWALPCDFHLCADTCLLHASSAAHLSRRNAIAWRGSLPQRGTPHQERPSRASGNRPTRPPQTSRPARTDRQADGRHGLSWASPGLSSMAGPEGVRCMDVWGGDTVGRDMW